MFQFLAMEEHVLQVVIMLTMVVPLLLRHVAEQDIALVDLQ
jgi:hypothetical protein